MKTTRCGRRLVPGFHGVLAALTVALAADPVPRAPTNAVAPPGIVAPALSVSVGEPAPSSLPPVVANTPAPSDTTATAAVAIEPVSTPVESADALGTSPVTSAAVATSSATSIALEVPGASFRKPDEDAQRRLEVLTPEQLIERHGSIGYLFRQSEPRSFLEIINPFAPAEFGPRVRETYNRNPNLKPGATLPRNFINDMTHEPVKNLFDWAW